MKTIYDGFQITDKLSEAMNNFEDKYPDKDIYVLAFELFLEQNGYYQKKYDLEKWYDEIGK